MEKGLAAPIPTHPHTQQLNMLCYMVLQSSLFNSGFILDTISVLLLLINCFSSLPPLQLLSLLQPPEVAAHQEKLKWVVISCFKFFFLPIWLLQACLGWYH